MEKVVHKFEFVARLQIRRERSHPPGPRRRSFLEPPASGAQGNYFGFSNHKAKRSKPRLPQTTLFHNQQHNTMIQALLLTILLANPSQFNHLQIDQTEGGWADELATTAKAAQVKNEGQENPFVGMAGFIIGSDWMPWSVTAVNTARQTATVVVSSGPGAGTYEKVPYSLFEKTGGSSYIIASDINPYQ